MHERYIIFGFNKGFYLIFKQQKGKNMFKKVVLGVMSAICITVFFTGCDEAAIERMAKAAKNTEAEEKEAKSVAKKFLLELCAGNPSTAMYYLSSNSTVDRDKLRDFSYALRMAGGDNIDVKVLGAKVNGNKATVDVVFSEDGDDSSKTNSVELEKESGSWKVLKIN